MQIVVHFLTRPTFRMTVSPDESIKSVKNKIQNHMNVFPNVMTLCHIDRNLDEQLTLAQYRIPDGAHIRCKCSM
ncbi:unnamed protein product [Echinostoma caproni]|uniref:Ubiquitin-like domain-containing protein n=1 Tax=Echinostoma caproni TaxID=27848 RepID=A0A183A9C2_9TREM|nr:unnamed protein product [Echinostoma caproni]